ncbi:MAG: dienelactone hydrolase family protein [Xanthobacteraceae bacterium]|jgi:dienelactone hydrolase
MNSRQRCSARLVAIVAATFACFGAAGATSLEQAKAQCREKLTPVVRECVHRKAAESGGSPSTYIPGCRAAVMPRARACVAELMGAAKPHGASDADRPPEIALPPRSGQGRVVILISGSDGPEAYRAYAEKIAGLGYYAVVLDGRNIMSSDMQGAGRLQEAIERAQSSPHALPGKIGVIGFSLGGGGALAYAERLPDTVSTVISYYPLTAFIAKVTDMKTFVGKFRVPLLVFAGGQDTYKSCCLLTTMRSMEATAKELGAPMEVVVYPDAGHAFIQGSNFRAGDADDAWRRTTDALHSHLGETPDH